MIILGKDYEVGVAKIDEQHKELVKRLNTVIGLGASSVTKSETEKTLKFVEDYIIKHFHDEEQLQIQCGYPKYEWHKNQHKVYINAFQKVKKEYHANGPSAKYTLELNNSIIKWIVTHIKMVDVEFGKYYLSQQ